MLLLDTTEQERRGLAFRKLTRLTQPWVTENPVMMLLVLVLLLLVLLLLLLLLVLMRLPPLAALLPPERCLGQGYQAGTYVWISRLLIP